MAMQLTIHVAGEASRTIDLISGSNRIGSEAGCDIRIDHPEVSAHAANLQNRSGAMLLQNLNGYVVYIGSEAVSPSAWADWPAEQTLQLTRSVSLALTDSSTPAVTNKISDSEAKRKKAKSTFQIAVIALCGVGILFLLTVDPEASRAKKLDFSAEILVQELAEGLQINSEGATGGDIEDQALLRYLQKAWAADLRWSKADPGQAIEAYEILLHHRKVQEAEQNDTEIYGKIRMLAQTRLDELGLRKRSRRR